MYWKLKVGKSGSREGRAYLEPLLKVEEGWLTNVPLCFCFFLSSLVLVAGFLSVFLFFFFSSSLFFFSILSPFPFWFLLLLAVMEGEWSCWSRSENPTCCSQWRQGCSREEELPDVASTEAERVFGCRAATAIAALGGRSYGGRGFDGQDGRELQWRRLQLGRWLGL